MSESNENKIKFGLKNVHYAIATIAADGTATYETPVAIPGAVNLNVDPQGDMTKFYADNIVYWIGNGNSGYEGTLEIAKVPDHFKKDVLRYIKDAKDVLVEDANAEVVHIALLFQFEGDKKATKHVLYNCVASRPSASGSTKEDNISPETETLNLSATTIYNSSLATDIVKSEATGDSDATTYDGWFSAVYSPTAATTNVTT